MKFTYSLLCAYVLLHSVMCSPVLRTTYVHNTPENIALIESNAYNQNIEEISGQFEGDMVLTLEQEAMALGREERTGLIDTNYRWPENTVVYEFSDIFSVAQREYIERGMREIEAISCIRFRERTTEVNYVEVNGLDSGCHSNVGHLNNGRQNVNFQLNVPGSGCFRLGTIIHEFLHTLGFYHMQSATERDDFVRIAFEHIDAGHEHNFNTYDANRISNFGELYDVTSVMHYSAYGFSKNGFATIIPNDITLINVMGQRDGMSTLDIRRLNAMYCNA